MAEYETREFTARELDDLGIDCGAACVISDDIIDQKRWSIVHRAVFLFEGEFYEVNYEEPATESQETDTWGGRVIVVARRVRPKQVSSVRFVPVEKRSVQSA